MNYPNRLGFLQFHKLRQVIFIEWIGLAQIAIQIELVVPDLPGWGTLLKEQHHGFHARTGKDAAGQIQHGMQVAAFQQQFAQAHRGIIGIGEEGVLDDDTALAAGFEDLDEMLQEEKGGLAGLDGKVLLHLGAFLAAERAGWPERHHSGPSPEYPSCSPPACWYAGYWALRCRAGSCS